MLAKSGPIESLHRGRTAGRRGDVWNDAPYQGNCYETNPPRSSTPSSRTGASGQRRLGLIQNTRAIARGEHRLAYALASIGTLQSIATERLKKRPDYPPIGG